MTHPNQQKFIKAGVSAMSTVLLALFLLSCDSGSAPVVTAVPQGAWTRTTVVPGGGRIHSEIILQLDSAFLTDTTFSYPGGVQTVDSIHSVALELSQAGDGYFRAVEEHIYGGSDITSKQLRYWLFFVRDDSLYFYRGMRLRGRNAGLKGNWKLSEADSAFIGESYSYSFSDDNVTIKQLTPGGTSSVTYPYRIDRDSVIIDGDSIPDFGDRFELVPGLAVYLTSHRERGYAKIVE